MSARKVVFITGASSGIGRAAAIAFATAGYNVAGTARREERLTALRDEIAQLTGEHGAFLPVVGDVTQRESMQAAVARTVVEFGRLDILIANAGLGQKGTVVDAEWQHIETLLRTNIDGVLHSIRACVPEMRKVGGGHIMTISSVSFNLVSPNTASYAASKAFVSSLAKSLRLELADDNIKVTDFLLGRTSTEFNEKRLGGARAGEDIPNMTPEQVADALVKAAYSSQQTVTLRWIDRLIVLGNKLIPNVIGYFAKRSYK